VHEPHAEPKPEAENQETTRADESPTGLSGGPSLVRGGNQNDPMNYWYGDSDDRESEIDPRTLNGDRGIGGTF
jgi:hypothetical protein